MTIDEAIALIKIERECVNRNNQPFGMNCDRECGKCDLLQSTDDLIEMYDNISGWLEELKELRAMVRCNAFKDGYNKAIDNFVKNLYKMGEYKDFDWDDIFKLAEQLKESEKNERI